MSDYVDSSFEYIVPAEDGRRFGVGGFALNRIWGVTVVAQWDEAQKAWSRLPMSLGTVARIKNRVLDLRWDTASCLGAHPAPGGFSFDFFVPFWDEPDEVWRATYSKARQCFDLKKLPFNPYDTSRKSTA